MNVDLLLKPAFGCKKKMQILHNFMRSLDLSQIKTEPTRITEQSKSLIDVILVNNQHRIVDSDVVSLSISDHSPIYCVLKAGVPKATPRTIKYRSFKGFDENAFIQNLKNVPWHIVDDESNVNDAVLTWNKLFTEVVDSRAPLKKRRVKGTTAPWMNNKIAEAMRDRNYHLRKAQKSNSTYHWGMYRKLRNFVNREIKSSKSNYYCNLIEESKGDSSMVWKAVNEASSRNVSSSIPQYIISSGVQCNDPKSIAKALDNYFASVGSLLAEKFSQSLNYVNPAKLNVAEPATVSFELKTVSHSFVLQQICALKRNKAIGLDRISARLLKCASRTITPSITKLLNLSVATNEFPNIWICSKVTALFKARNRTTPSDYRPIYILPTLSKILERAVHYQFYQYPNQHNLLNEKQFGFRPKHSTVNAVSSFADEILFNMERGKLCGAVFLDISKAFDTVDHTILLRKLSSFGVTSDTAKWFESYLN